MRNISDWTLGQNKPKQTQSCPPPADSTIFESFQTFSHAIFQKLARLMRKLAQMIDFSTCSTTLLASGQPEQEGFEPPVPFGTTVFKTVALNHSATAPKFSVQRIAFSVQYNQPCESRKSLPYQLYAINSYSITQSPILQPN